MFRMVKGGLISLALLASIGSEELAEEVNPRIEEITKHHDHFHTDDILEMDFAQNATKYTFQNIYSIDPKEMTIARKSTYLVLEWLKF